VGIRAGGAVAAVACVMPAGRSEAGQKVVRQEAEKEGEAVWCSAQRDYGRCVQCAVCLLPVWVEGVRPQCVWGRCSGEESPPSGSGSSEVWHAARGRVAGE